MEALVPLVLGFRVLGAKGLGPGLDNLCTLRCLSNLSCACLGNTRPLLAQLAPFLTGTGTEPVDLKAMVVGSQISIDLRQSILVTW